MQAKVKVRLALTEDEIDTMYHALNRYQVDLMERSSHDDADKAARLREKLLSSIKEE